MEQLKKLLEQYHLTEDDLIRFIKSSKYRDEIRDKDYVLYRELKDNLANRATSEDLLEIKDDIKDSLNSKIDSNLRWIIGTILIAFIGLLLTIIFK